MAALIGRMLYARTLGKKNILNFSVGAYSIRPRKYYRRFNRAYAIRPYHLNFKISCFLCTGV